MAKKLLDGDYDDLKKFYIYFSKTFLGYNEASSVVEKLESISGTLAKQGLVQAVNDIVEETKRYSFDRLSIVDSDLRAQNTLTLSEIRRRYSKTYQRILKRNHITTDVEYYLIKGILASNDLPADEQNALVGLVAEYEAG